MNPIAEYALAVYFTECTPYLERFYQRDEERLKAAAKRSIQEAIATFWYCRLREEVTIDLSDIAAATHTELDLLIGAFCVLLGFKLTGWTRREEAIHGVK